MTASPITGQIIVLRFSDRSGLIAAFGPYPTEPAARVALEALKLMPLADGEMEVLPIFGAPGLPPTKQPVYRGGTDG